jgi:hypothetical protein
MPPTQLLQEIEALRLQGHNISITEDGSWVSIVFHEYPVPSGFTKQKTNLLVRAQQSYPNSSLDMFWTDVDLLLEGGGVPASADQLENYNGQQWRRFSWHPQSWNPGRDNLCTFLEFINTRFAQRK